MNSMHVIGRLGADAETIEGKNGKFVTFRMASNDWVNGKEVTSWFKVTLFGDRGLKAIEWLKKGRMVHVVGTEAVTTYQAKDGTTQVSREITAESFNFISTGSKDAEEKKDEKVTTGTFMPTAKEKVQATAVPDDIPF